MDQQTQAPYPPTDAAAYAEAPGAVPMGDAGNTAVPYTPATPDPMMAKVSRLVQEQFDQQGWKFSIQQREMTNADIASPTGLLSVVAFRAASLYEEAMGKPMPLYFYTNPDALCEVSPAVEEDRGNTMIFWSHFVHYAMETWVKRFPELTAKNAPIPLDEMYDQWFDAASNNKLTFRETMVPRARAGGM